jgi:thiol-disulfide isomerase/thioredoxin
MSRNHFRFFLIFTFCGIAAAGARLLPGFAIPNQALAADEPQAELEPLTIGGTAPELDIEHWVSDGNGFFKPVTQFETGKVYVVEFWATWCGPCIASMPHLAEIQNKYRGRDVQIVSISDEPLETVEEFLKREAEVAEDEKKTFAEITSAYCLTTDPDRSAYQAYMDGSQQQGIPTSFIVGKDAKIEWIGHPMEMDGPLEQVVEGKWDRAAFIKMFEAEKKFDEMLQQISLLAGSGKYEEAINLIDAEIKSDVPLEIRDRWTEIRQRVKLSAGMIDKEVVDFFTDDLAKNKGNAIGVARIGWSMYQVSREKEGLDELLTLCIESLKAELATVSDDDKPLALDTLAHLYQAAGDLDAAIKSQTEAVEITEGRTSQRLARFLKELEEQKANQPEADEK